MYSNLTSKNIIRTIYIKKQKHRGSGRKMKNILFNSKENVVKWKKKKNLPDSKILIWDPKG